jgi:hypothetical protein
MRTKLLILAALLTLLQTGCATTFRAGGRHGPDGGAPVGPPPAPVVVPQADATPPPPPAR